MIEINDVAAKLQSLLAGKGPLQYAFSVSESDKKELNTENSDFNLFRTIFDNSVSLTVIRDGRKGAAEGNDLTDAGLEKVVEDAVLGAESSVPDEANAIAEGEAPEVFRSGPYEARMDVFYTRLKELLDESAANHPKVRILQLIADHTQTHTLYVNSNGTRFEHYDGVYHVTLEMSGSDGDKATGLDYVELATHDLDTPLLKQGSLAAHLEAVEKSLESASFDGKFEGRVIFTPDCLLYFIYMLASNYLMSPVIMDGTSQWLDKVGEKVSSEKITMSLKAEDPRIAALEPYTSDGYRAENVTLIENGVLKNQVLNLYAARKTGRPVTKNTSFSIAMEPGETALKDMIASIDRGLIVGGFSGGEPGANGEFSGVAKNSFYVEKGRVVGAVSETMINGNLEAVFRNVAAVSREWVSNGDGVLPYLACDGIVISGK